MLELLTMFESWNLVDATIAVPFAKPQIQHLYSMCNGARLEDYLENGLSMVLARAQFARDDADAARQHADAGDFASDMGRRAAKNNASKLEHLAAEAEEHARAVLITMHD